MTVARVGERRSATGAGAGAARLPWASLERAAKRLKWPLASTGTPGRRSLALPGGTGAVTVSLDLRRPRFSYRMSLGSRPPDHGRWTLRLAATQGALSICRFALSGGELCLAAESPAHKDEGELAAHLRLLRLDLATGRSAYAEHCESGRRRRLRRSSLRRPRAVARQVRGAAVEAVATWLQDAVAIGWQPIAQDHCWRLIRESWAPAGQPPVCQLDLTPTTLVASAALPLRGELARECREALALFLLRKNARLTVRSGLAGSNPDPAAAPEVRIEAAIPLAGLEQVQVAQAVAAVCAGYAVLRREVEALCNSQVAQLFILCQTQRGASMTAPPMDA